MRLNSIVVFCVLLLQWAHAQTNDDITLAQQFFNNGEYLKAGILYEKIWSKNKTNDYFYQQYFKCLIQQKELDKALVVCQDQAKRNAKNPIYYVDMATVYAIKNEVKKSDDNYKKAVDIAIANPNFLELLLYKLKENKKYDYTLDLLLKAQKNNSIARDLNWEIAKAYQSKEDYTKAAEYYILCAEMQPNMRYNVYSVYERELNSEKALRELQKQCYSRIQKNPNAVTATELLIWILRHNKNYEDAFIQAKALDKQMKEDGTRVLDVAEGARAEKQYDIAVKAYQYVVDKGENNNLYYNAQLELLSTMKQKMDYANAFSIAEVTTLLQRYENIFATSGRTNFSFPLIMQYAEIQALHAHKPEKAVAELENALQINNLSKNEIAECKIDLGDYYLMNKNIWDATLMYGQVDKAFKEDEIGDEARYRNARLSYFKGDFDWARTQLNVLKTSTSDLISNNSIDLSVFIMDNLGLDTTAQPLELFAQGQLLAMQNLEKEAFAKWDSIKILFPEHSLYDDILFEKAKIAYKHQQYDKAADLYENIVANYKQSILTDDCLYHAALLYEEKLNNPDKAKQLYEAIIEKHASSIFAVDARKRYRKLRGDNL